MVMVFMLLTTASMIMRVREVLELIRSDRRS